MPEPTIIFGAVCYTIASVAFAAFAIVLAIGWKGALQGSLMIVACLGTSVWAGASAYADWIGSVSVLMIRVVVLSELFRDIAWITFLWSMLTRFGPGQSGIWRPAYILPSAFAGYALLAALELNSGLGFLQAIPKTVLVISLTLSVAGVVLTETLYRNGSQDERWRNKFLCLAIGGVFAFNMFLNSDAILLNRVDPSLIQAKGAVQLLLVPLIAIAIVRNRLWRTNLSLSHDIVLHSTAFIFGGIYLFLMAVVGYYLRGLGAAWGSVAQITFLFGAVVLLAVVMFSGTSRAYLKVFFSKHFFKERYDYREEWRRFMQTLSEGLTTTSLEERAILAVADIVESPGGAIWLKDGDRFVLSGSRNLAIDDFQERQGGPLTSFLAQSQWVVSIEEAVANPTAYSGLALPPEFRRSRRAWVIVPLWHHELIGFMVLAEPRAPHPLVWEDFDLLKTIGRQIASYMAEQRADRALTEAREFEEFNRRYAFVIHDIKNIVSQLSLVTANFHKYSDNPDFLEDMIKTVDEAVGKMNRITDKISERQHVSPPPQTVALVPLLERVVAAKKISGATLLSDISTESLIVSGDDDRLEATVGHLVQNAIEATGKTGKISISLRRRDNNAVLEITDDGPGMDPEFVRKELFKPFRSTKGRGFGIGAYQCRAYARELGGCLDVESHPGQGTTMRMLLPLTEPQSAAAPTTYAPGTAQ